MTLEREDEIVSAPLNESGKLQSKIRCFPKYNGLCWLRDGQKLDITDPKYIGSYCYDDFAALYIHYVESEDDGTYTIEVHNKFGKGESSLELEVINGKIYSIIKFYDCIHCIKCFSITKSNLCLSFIFSKTKY